MGATWREWPVGSREWPVGTRECASWAFACETCADDRVKWYIFGLNFFLIKIGIF